MYTQALKKSQGGTAESTSPPAIVPPPQVESFVYRSMESTADLHLAKMARSTLHYEMHGNVYAVFIVCWAALLSIFALTFWGSPYTLYMIGVALLTGVAYFALPIVLSRVDPKKCDACFTDFLRSNIQTLTGPVMGVEALAQVIMVPAALTVGALAIAFIVHASKLAY